MSRKYKNFCDIIHTHGCRVLMTEDKFLENGMVVFICSKDHISNITSSSFTNKSAPKKMSTCSSLCSDCSEYQTILEKLLQRATSLDFEIIELLPDRKHVIYRCRCGSVHQCEVKGICRSRRTSTCPSCQHSLKKKDFSNVQEVFTNRQCRLMSTESEYQNNSSKLKYICRCGREAFTSYHDFSRGRLCMACSAERRIVSKGLSRKKSQS